MEVVNCYLLHDYLEAKAKQIRFVLLPPDQRLFSDFVCLVPLGKGCGFPAGYFV